MQGLHPKALREIKLACASNQFKFFMDEGKYDEGEPGNCYLMFAIENGLYKGQTHILQIRWNYGSNEKKQFPRHPPNVKFLTPMWHTNVSRQEGGICVDILRDDSTNPNAWSPIYGLDAIFNSILLLLEEHNPDSAYNHDASNDYTMARDNKNMAYFSERSLAYYNKLIGNLSPKSKLYKLLHAPEFKLEAVDIQKDKLVKREDKPETREDEPI
jgi:ubiquitin-protein ligase